MVFGLGCLPQLQGKTRLLKAPNNLELGLGRIELELTSFFPEQ